MRNTALKMLPEVLNLLSQYRLRVRQLETPHRTHRDISNDTRIMGSIDCSEDGGVDPNAGETRAPVPVLVQDHQTKTRGKTKVQTGN